MVTETFHSSNVIGAEFTSVFLREKRMSLIVGRMKQEAAMRATHVWDRHESNDLVQTRDSLRCSRRRRAMVFGSGSGFVKIISIDSLFLMV